MSKNVKKFLLLPTTLFLFFNIWITNGFNIDTSYPVIIKNSADGSNSHFGFTVVLINETDPGIIVGSPKSTSTLPAHADIPEPGVVWQCSFHQSSNICRVIVMDPTGNAEDPYHQNVTDRKNFGWLGGALGEDGDDFFACGSRWSNQEFASTATTPTNYKDERDYYMNGICHWRPKKDIFQVPLPPVSPQSRLLPIIANENQPKNKWGAGQAGFSIHTPQNSQEILLGAPGLDRWRGSVIRLSQDDSGNKFGNTFVWSYESSSLQLQLHSYFGFAITSGKFFKNKSNSPTIQYVAGAPRGRDLKGQVVVFQMPLATSEDILAEVLGNQIGSYFGSSLCVADINGDGWDDLLVGAPLYSVEYKMPKGTKIAKSISGNGDEGTVFVYLSNKVNNFGSPSRINGHQPWSHFGTAIANLGDINNDGYEDIAVGAPYANNGTGVVYIYHGSQTGISREPAQEIEGKSFDTLVKGFGYSLSSGKDIDLNGYNDLAVGAYDSGHVVLFRTRPLISIYGEVRSKETKLSFDTERFEVESCIQYTGGTAPSKMDFTVTITADLLSFPKRVFLEFPEQSNSATNHTYQEELYAGIESCTKFIAVVKLPLEITGKTISIKQTIISISEGIRVSGTTSYEILTRFGEQANTRVSGPGYQAFCKTCPLKDSASSKTKELLLPLAVFCGDDDKCVSDIQIGVSFLELRPEDTSFIIGSSPVLTLEVKVDNLKEPAISPYIRVSWNSKTLKKTPPQCGSPWSNDSYTEINCPMGRTLEKDTPKTISFELDMTEIDAGSLEELVIQINVSTASEVYDSSTMSKIVRIKLIYKADIFMEASSSSTKFNLETLSPKTILQHRYEIGLDGPSSIAGAVVNFQIPVNVEHASNPKTTFDVGEPTTSVTGSKTTISCYAEAPFYFKKFSRITVSKRMEDDGLDPPDDGGDDDDEEEEDSDGYSNNSTTEEIKTGGILTGKKSRKELIIDCGAGSKSEATVKCMNVRCRIYNMNAGSRISVEFNIRVSSSSLKKLFQRSKFSHIKYVSNGGAEILGANYDIQPPNHKLDSATYVSMIEEEFAKPVSHLIYLLGIFIGFIILALIVYCLYRSGVFNRKKPQAPKDEPDSSDPLQKKESQQNDGGGGEEDE